MRELAAQGLQIVLIAIGFGAVAHMIFMLFAGSKHASEGDASASFWSTFLQRTKGHLIPQLVLFALMVLAFLALGWLNKQHPVPLSR